MLERGSGWMLAFPGTTYNTTNGCDRSCTDWLVLSTNRFLDSAGVRRIRIK
jgi:hypothetical protein